MEINDALIDKLSALARLEFKGEEKERIKKDFEAMLGFVDKLKEVDVEGIEPLIYITEDPQELRADIASQEISHEDALKNAPKKDSDYFKVPRVLNS